jgi:glutamine amidotransferase
VAFGAEAVTAAVWQGSLGACQFHPEKSAEAGEAMLRRWLHWLEQRQP